MSEVRWSRRRLAAAGWLRVAIGAGLASRPTALPRALGVDSATAARIGWLGTMLGVRDAALGAGLVHALRTRRSPQPWLLAGAIHLGLRRRCSSSDAVADVPRRRRRRSTTSRATSSRSHLREHSRG